MLIHDEAVDGVRFVVTGRSGGVSAPPYDGLNLATHVGDDPQAVARNRSLLQQALGVAGIAWMDQVHGTEVAVVERAGTTADADALVTRTRGLVLAVLVADCTPVLVADAEAGLVAVAHAGRRGLADGVVPALLTTLRELGGRRLVARVGPSICPRCYPVPAGMRAEVGAVQPAAWSVAADGQPSLDIAAGVVAQLAEADVAVRWWPGCSAESPQHFSYRASGGTTGRYAGLVWLP